MSLSFLGIYFVFIARLEKGDFKMAWFFDRDYILAIYEDVSKLKITKFKYFYTFDIFVYIYFASRHFWELNTCRVFWLS